jgi:hypothetical protein
MCALISESTIATVSGVLRKLLRHDLRRHVKGAAVAIFLIAASETTIKEIHILTNFSCTLLFIIRLCLTSFFDTSECLEHPIFFIIFATIILI